MCCSVWRRRAAGRRSRPSSRSARGRSPPAGAVTSPGSSRRWTRLDAAVGGARAVGPGPQRGSGTSSSAGARRADSSPSIRSDARSPGARSASAPIARPSTVARAAEEPRVRARRCRTRTSRPARSAPRDAREEARQLAIGRQVLDGVERRDRELEAARATGSRRRSAAQQQRAAPDARRQPAQRAPPPARASRARDRSRRRRDPRAAAATCSRPVPQPRSRIGPPRSSASVP